ncbi:ribosome-associated translation inhibitor RaiA [bacterium]|nr:ribosome-associated translation inhibitor RaiA [bacterium]
MQLTVTGRDMPLTPSLKDYVEKRLERVERHIPRIIRVAAVLSKERQDHVASIRLTAANLKLAVTARSPDMYASIDAAVGKLERSALRAKERKIQEPRVRASRAKQNHPDESRPSGSTAVGDEELKVTRLWVKPMSAEEALLQIKTLSYSFFVFRDADDNQVKVMYRRNDRAFGLIEPDLE